MLWTGSAIPLLALYRSRPNLGITLGAITVWTAVFFAMNRPARNS